MTWETAAFESGPKRRGRFPLLPDDPFIGWTPYAWLIYLGIFFIEPMVRTSNGAASAAYWAATLIGTAVFLVTYFRVHWAGGRELVVLILLLVGLGVAYAPINTGSSVFIVYAACFAGQLPDRRAAYRILLAIPVISAATAWAVGAPMYFWLAAVVLAPLFGAVLLHFAAAQRAARQLVRAQEDIEHLATIAERERIGRDMHDVLGHTLSLVVLKAELAGKLITRDPERARAEMRDAEEVARTALQELRETLRGYRTTVAAEIARARAIFDAAGIECTVDMAQLDTGRDVEETLALALREAATNVARHSGAHTCRIVVAIDDGSAVLAVEDDGRGVRAPEGSGLRGMRERVESLRGTVEHRAGRGGRGTLLRVTIPEAGRRADALAAAARDAVTAAAQDDASAAAQDDATAAAQDDATAAAQDAPTAAAQRMQVMR